ncbi:MAG: hypothetical protein K0S55_804, partial [Clostridia bacterium]|nr:hypothetical protein [Clostridia bacterium]
FTVPSEWFKLDTEEETEDDIYFDVEFMKIDESIGSIAYLSYDIWSEMSVIEKIGKTKSDMNNSALHSESFLQKMGYKKDEITYVTYNDIEYIQFNSNELTETDGSTLTFNMVNLTYLRDGIIYLFKYTYIADSQYYSDFIGVMNNVEYPPLINPADNPGIVLTDTDYHIIVFFVTVFLYILPIIIYRFLIRKKPVLPSKALHITALYGIFSFIAMFLLLKDSYGSFVLILGNVIFFMSLLNYCVLSAVRKKYIVDLKFCKSCGVSLEKDSHYCSKCGASIGNK